MIQIVDDGVYDELAASGDLITALGGTAIYNQIAPIDTEYPYVVYGLNGGSEDNETQVDSFNYTYFVRVVSDNALEAVQTAGTVRDVLHKCELALAGSWGTYSVQHTAPISYMEMVDNVPIYHSGGLYRIRGSE